MQERVCKKGLCEKGGTKPPFFLYVNRQHWPSDRHIKLLRQTRQQRLLLQRLQRLQRQLQLLLRIRPDWRVLPEWYQQRWTGTAESHG